MSTCIYCKSIFATKGVMLFHQKKAKYCLLIQKGINPELKTEKISCSYCDKSFIRKDVKSIHEDTCKNNYNNNEIFIQLIKDHNIKIREYEIKIMEYEKKLNERDNEISILKVKLEGEINRGNIFEKLHTKSEDCVEKIALQPKTTSTNTVLNIPCFNTTLEQLTNAAVDKFDENLFLQGQAGAAKFFLDYVKSSNNGSIPWIVSDKSREILKFKDDNEIVIDHKVKRLTQLVSDAIKTRNQEHYDNIYKNISTTRDDEYESDNDENKESSIEESSIEDREEESSVDDIKEQQADKCYVEIKKLTKDNKVFRKKIIEGSYN